MLHLPLGPTVAVDVVAWALLSLAAGYGLHRTSTARLDHDTWVTRLRPFERSGRRYERLGIRRWKDHLPEAGALFAGGISKRSSGGRNSLHRFAIETRRAEYTHWVLLAVSPLFALWNPWFLTIAMVAYAVVANLPFVIVQRYNRGRIERLLSRRPPRPTGASDPGDDAAPAPDGPTPARRPTAT